MISPEAWQAVAAWAAVGAGAIGFFFGLRATARARLRALENVYFERYWTIVDKFDHAALRAQQPRHAIRHRRCGRCCTRDQTDPDDVADSAETRKACVLYLRLCEDELRLRESGLVSADTWCAWKKGMAYQHHSWPVRGEWKDIRDASPSNGRQFRLLRKCEPSPDDTEMTDPLPPRHGSERISCRWRGTTHSERADRRRREQRQATPQGSSDHGRGNRVSQAGSGLSSDW